MVKKIFGLPLFFLAYLLVANSTFAVNIPDFPLCPNPGGTVIASYDEGTHGIVGDYNTHTGSDKVYKTTDTTYVQCFCPTAGNDGIQTKWWNASSLTEDEIKGLQNSGWIFVGNGAEWGLINDPFIAMNSSFSCNGGTGGGGGSSQSSSSSNQGSQGQVLGASTTVLAATNSSLILPRVLAAILIALAISIVLLI
jgi:hypothetical protein